MLFYLRVAINPNIGGRAKRGQKKKKTEIKKKYGVTGTGFFWGHWFSGLILGIIINNVLAMCIFCEITRRLDRVHAFVMCETCLCES